MIKRVVGVGNMSRTIRFTIAFTAGMLTFIIFTLVKDFFKMNPHDNMYREVLSIIFITLFRV